MPDDTSQDLILVVGEGLPHPFKGPSGSERLIGPLLVILDATMDPPETDLSSLFLKAREEIPPSTLHHPLAAQRTEPWQKHGWRNPHNVKGKNGASHAPSR